MGMYNIQVNAIAPGWFPTDMSEKVIQRNKESLLANIPLGRFGGPNDLKGAAIFLASDASDFVTGHTLVVDEGNPPSEGEFHNEHSPHTFAFSALRGAPISHANCVVCKEKRYNYKEFADRTRRLAGACTRAVSSPVIGWLF